MQADPHAAGWDEASRLPESMTIKAPSAGKSPIVIPFGTLVIEDITGNLLHRAVVPVVDNGWIALPMPLSLGGYSWHLWIGDKKKAPIEGGLFRDFDTIGIWQSVLPPPATGPPLARWSETVPLDWYALHSDDVMKGVTTGPCEEQGYFIRCSLPYGIAGPGIFIQGEFVVGWTFETGGGDAHLWNGDTGGDLTAEIRMEAYYSQTFAESREEKWLQALAGVGGDNIQRLEDILHAYRYPRKLADSQLLPILDPDHMTAQLLIRMEELTAAGYGDEVVNRFDRQILLEIDNPDVVITLAELTAQIYGNEAAITTIEWVKDYLTLSSADSVRFSRIHRDLYTRLLEEMTQRGDWGSVAQWLSAARTQYPDDPLLYLFEIRLALSSGNWDDAEQLLTARTYPETASRQVAELQAEIDRMKASDGQVVVRFRPGSRNIRVTADLNGELSQAFLIDTGASMVTIPESTARRLGISLEDGAPIRTVFTAGGPVAAHEVTIDEITLNGWRIGQVAALVLDIPGQPELGLLGLNYLSRFDMDLQAEKGLLILTPK